MPRKLLNIVRGTMAVRLTSNEGESVSEQTSNALKLGLALSGGGFRATLFNLGSLWRLNEFGVLPRISIITAVSGGSIALGVLARNWPALGWEELPGGKRASNFEELVVAPIRAICGASIDIGAGLEGLFSFSETIADRVAARYDELFFQGSRLSDLPDAVEGSVPRFVFYATSLQTGASVRISKKYLADYHVGIFDAPDLSLAQVVGASSAFPPVLSPVVLRLDPNKWRNAVGANLYENPRFRRELVLTDGGVYDNMGTEAIWHRCETVLVSDAGAPLAADGSPSRDWTGQLKRTLDIVTEQTRALRKRWLVQEFKDETKAGTYWGITTKIAHYEVDKPLMVDSEDTAALQNVRTRLNPFTDSEQQALINWGYALTDAAIRKHVPTIRPSAGKLPYGLN